MTCIASAVGLGNVWRFPSIMGKHGGGAFLIPYIICISVVGAPLYYLELSLGQFASRGPIKVWEMAPLFKGAKSREICTINKLSNCAMKKI